MISPSHRFVCSMLSIIGTAGLVAMADPASAATTDATGMRQVAVTYADLDLNSPAGRTTFEHRIATAATQVCDTGMRGVDAVSQSCRTAAIARAHRAVGMADDIRNG